MLLVERKLREAIEAGCQSHASYSTEDKLQECLAKELGNATREIKMVFDRPAIPIDAPPPEAIEECASKGRKLPKTGKDPCDGKNRKLDILWENSEGSFAIELKGREDWGADTTGYHFLKDLHRLERLSALESGTKLSDLRFSVFVTSVPDFWRKEPSREPEEFRIFHGHTLEPGYWVQYKQPSAVTRWHGYPPFYLAHPYKFEWTDLNNNAKYLLVCVNKQGTVEVMT